MNTDNSSTTSPIKTIASGIINKLSNQTLDFKENEELLAQSIAISKEATQIFKDEQTLLNLDLSQDL